ncbi:MAG: DivIVA domain-containing protein [Firmicutes bacterium]|nr:DivIVA domain-containing protein [Bacillota bacterium]
MITPNDIENLQFKKTPLGYSTEEVDEFLDKLVVDYEKVFKDNVKLNARANMLEEQIKKYDSMEETIKTSIMLAEKTVKETKANAEEQADNILDRAEIEAEKLIAKTIDRKTEIEQEIYALKKSYRLLKAKMRMLLESEIKLLDEDDIDDLDNIPDEAPKKQQRPTQKNRPENERRNQQKNAQKAKPAENAEPNREAEREEKREEKQEEKTPLTVPQKKMDKKKAEQAEKLKVLADLFEE